MSKARKVATWLRLKIHLFLFTETRTIFCYSGNPYRSNSTMASLRTTMAAATTSMTSSLVSPHRNNNNYSSSTTTLPHSRSHFRVASSILRTTSSQAKFLQKVSRHRLSRWPRITAARFRPPAEAATVSPLFIRLKMRLPPSTMASTRSQST